MKTLLNLPNNCGAPNLEASTNLSLSTKLNEISYKGTKIFCSIMWDSYDFSYYYIIDHNLNLSPMIVKLVGLYYHAETSTSAPYT